MPHFWNGVVGLPSLVCASKCRVLYVQVTIFSYASSIFRIFASGPIELYVKVCENIKQQLENS